MSRVALRALTWLALTIGPAVGHAQQGCRIVARSAGPSTTPAVAALAAGNFGMEGHVRAVLVDTAVRESHHLVPEAPERLPIVAALSKAAVAALATSSSRTHDPPLVDGSSRTRTEATSGGMFDCGR